MALGPSGAVVRQLQTLYRVGAVGGMTDGQLLERFLGDRDRDGGEAAFEALVARHGPMVLAVCRQVLSRPHDVEDAFQAVFLVLVRRAGAIRKRDSVASWLHGVARRVAIRAKHEAARRRRREEVHADGRDRSRPSIALDSPEAAELRASLHAEIARLPEKYRAPVVLCDLEGRTHAEAAEQLRWPIGTVSGRLFRARELLRDRISRRGLALGVGLTALLAGGPVRASVAPVLAGRVLRAATAAARGPSLALGARLAWASVAAAAALAAAGAIVSEPMQPVSPRPAAVRERGNGPLGLRLEGDHRPGRDAVAARRETPRPAASERPSPLAAFALLGPTEAVTALAFAPDGRTFASAGIDHTVTLWDVATGREMSRLVGHEGTVLSLAFTHDGLLLASTAADHTLRLWDVATGRATLTLNQSPDDASLVALGRGPLAPDRGGPDRAGRATAPGRPASTDAPA